MAPRIGIDLGTTFSCAAWIDEDGRPIVIPSSDGKLTTPSVICFDGKQAWVGDKANVRKQIPGAPIREFIKHDMGRPAVADPAQPDVEPAPYRFGDTSFGAAGMSALILRKLKRDAVRFLRGRGVLPENAEELNTNVEAVITVPAYFGDAHRAATRLAGVAAGLDVIGIINEPTAAAISYSELRRGSARVLVFDLGGGTLDVTVLDISADGDRVISKAGTNQIGGARWDELIGDHLHEVFRERHGHEVPLDFGFEVQRLAIEAKHALSASPTTTVQLVCDEDDVEIVLHERAPDGGKFSSKSAEFYFERRARELLHACEITCEKALAEGTIESPAGPRPLGWTDIDEIVLAGGACRMPMIPRMLERISRKHIARHVDHFDYDTAIAIGAAHYSRNKGRINDTLSQSIGVLIRDGDRLCVEPIIKRNDTLPVSKSRTMSAEAHAELRVYEFPSAGRVLPDEARLRGSVDLSNDAPVDRSQLLLTFSIDEDGHLKVSAQFPPDERRELELRDALRWSSEDTEHLREKVLAVRLHS